MAKVLFRVAGNKLTKEETSFLVTDTHVTHEIEPVKALGGKSFFSKSETLYRLLKTSSFGILKIIYLFLFQQSIKLSQKFQEVRNSFQFL